MVVVTLYHILSARREGIIILRHVTAGYYFTGDGALRDEDGDYRITGRVDDVVNIKGHRIGTAEIECAMVCSTLHECILYIDLDTVCYDA